MKTKDGNVVNEARSH